MERRTSSLGVALVVCIGVAAYFTFRSARGERVVLTPAHVDAARAAAPASAASRAVAPGDPSGVRAAQVLPEGRRGVAVATVAESEAAGLRVRVVDPEGTGVADLLIVAGWRSHPGQLLRGFLGERRSDAFGRCSLPTESMAAVEDCQVRVDVEAPAGWAACTWRGALPREELVIELVRTGGLRGRVLVDGVECEQAGASLRFDWRLDGESAGEAACDVERGRYATGPDLAGEVVRVDLHRPGARRLQLQLPLLSVDAGLERELDLAFTTGFALELRVLDEATDQPIEGARVLPGGGSQSVTDASGAYRAERVFGPGEQVELRVEHADYQPLAARVPCPPGGGDVFETVRLRAGQRLQGSLVNVDGIPIEWAFVEARPGRGPRSRAKVSASGTARIVRTDERGHFDLRGLAPAPEYDLLFRNGRNLMAEYRVLAGAEGTYVVHRPLELRGVVRTADGSPASARQVSARSAHGDSVLSSLCTDDGRFAIPGLCPGEWYVSAAYGPARFLDLQGSSVQAAAGRWIEVVPDAAPDVELRLPEADARLERSVRVRAWVRDRRSRLPLERCDSLVIHGLDNDLDVALAPGAIGPAGLPFALPEGEYELWLAVAGYATGQRSVRLCAADEIVHVEFELDPVN